MDGVKSTRVYRQSTLGVICPTIARFVAAAFSVVAERTTLLRNKSGVSSA